MRFSFSFQEQAAFIYNSTEEGLAHAPEAPTGAFQSYHGHGHYKPFIYLQLLSSATHAIVNFRLNSNLGMHLFIYPKGQIKMSV